ncbi:MAG: DEAD/DEAH box helicase family protein [Planctomycetes bacterium]|nr:DEAD/DEAH box helicase family protein [Planctomycetota bacterium]
MAVSIEDFLKGPLATDGPGAERAARLLRRRRGTIHEAEEAGTTARKSKSYELASPEPLFDYQADVVASLTKARSDGVRSAMVSIPTGGGKTRTALWYIRKAIQDQTCRRAVWLAPSAELVAQAERTAQDLWRTFSPSPRTTLVLNDLEPPVARSDQLTPLLAIATVQLAAKRVDALRALQPDLVVYDEAHQAAARTSRDIVRALGDIEGCMLVGLSATPGRTLTDENELLSGLFGGNLIVPRVLGHDAIATLVGRGVLAHVETRQIPLPRQWDALRVRSTNAPSLSLDELALEPHRFWAIADTIEEIARKRRCLVFGSSIAHCEVIAAVANARNIRAESLSHNTPADKRELVLKLFLAGGIQVLTNKSLLMAGFDDPGLGDAVLATPIRSSIQWEQIVGRVSRGPSVGGKRSARVWELDDHSKLHDRVMAAQRFVGDTW